MLAMSVVSHEGGGGGGGFVGSREQASSEEEEDLLTRLHRLRQTLQECNGRVGLMDKKVEAFQAISSRNNQVQITATEKYVKMDSTKAGEKHALPHASSLKIRAMSMTNGYVNGVHIEDECNPELENCELLGVLKQSDPGTDSEVGSPAWDSGQVTSNDYNSDLLQSMQSRVDLLHLAEKHANEIYNMYQSSTSTLAHEQYGHNIESETNLAMETDDESEKVMHMINEIKRQNSNGYLGKDSHTSITENHMNGNMDEDILSPVNGFKKNGTTQKIKLRSFVKRREWWSEKRKEVDLSMKGIHENGTCMNDDRTSIHENGTSMNDDRTSIHENGTCMNDDRTSIHENGTCMNDDRTSIHENGICMNDDSKGIHENGICMNDDSKGIHENGIFTNDNRKDVHENVIFLDDETEQSASKIKDVIRQYHDLRKDVILEENEEPQNISNPKDMRSLATEETSLKTPYKKSKRGTLVRSNNVDFDDIPEVCKSQHPSQSDMSKNYNGQEESFITSKPDEEKHLNDVQDYPEISIDSDCLDICRLSSGPYTNVDETNSSAENGSVCFGHFQEEEFECLETTNEMEMLEDSKKYSSKSNCIPEVSSLDFMKNLYDHEEKMQWPKLSNSNSVSQLKLHQLGDNSLRDYKSSKLKGKKFKFVNKLKKYRGSGKIVLVTENGTSSKQWVCTHKGSLSPNFIVSLLFFLFLLFACYILLTVPIVTISVKQNGAVAF